MLERILIGLGIALCVLAPARGEDREAVRADRQKWIEKTRAEILQRIEQHGGFEAIDEALVPFRAAVGKELVAQSTNGIRTFKVGNNDFNKPVSLSAIKPTWQQEGDPSTGRFPPLDAIREFDRALKERGIDLIVIPVPSKIEVYAREFDPAPPPGMPVALGRVRAMLELLDSDVEVVDVRPTLLGLMTEDDDIPLYETTGHHISGLGVKHCGDLVAERLERYTFEGRDKSLFSDRQRRSVERISPSVRMQAWPVRYKRKGYEHVNESPVVIIGDSNAFAYKTASWASHIARATGIPVTDISTSSGASTAHVRLAGQGATKLDRRQVVIWIITSTHLERMGWPKAELKEEASLAGLITNGEYDKARDRWDEEIARGERPLLDEGDLDKTARRLALGGDPEAALAICELSVKAFPYSANARFSLGQACSMTGDKERAVECFKKALSLNPSQRERATGLSKLEELGVTDFELPPPFAPASGVLEAWTGQYSLSGSNTGIVTLEDGSLVFEFVGQPKMTLQPLSETVFTTSTGFIAVFRKENDKPGASVLLEGRGMRFEGSHTKRSP